MKKHIQNKYFYFYVILFVFCLIWVLTFIRAATTPTTGIEATYGVLSSTYTDTSGATTINGDVGFTTPPATAPLGVHTNYGSGAPYSTAGTAQATLASSLGSQVCDFTFGSAEDLSLLVQPLTAGVYCVTGAMSVGTGGITLTSGTYIFRSTGALNTVANSVVSGGDSCDVFWTPVATTLGANSTFKGTVIDDAGITVGAVTTWSGRALSFGGTVTTDTDTITVPSCISYTTPYTTPYSTPYATPTPSGGSNGQIACSSPSAPCPHPFISPTVTTTVTVVPIVVPVVVPVAISTSTIPKFPATGYPPKK